MTEYVAGFLMTERQVLLVRKNHPHHLAGKLNAIGGKIDPGETKYAAMCREFKEETDILITHWSHFCTLQGDYALHGPTLPKAPFRVEFFTAYCSSVMRRHRSMAEFPKKNDVDELVCWYDIEAILSKPQEHKTMANVTWLLPMARSFSLEERASSFTVVESY